MSRPARIDPSTNREFAKKSKEVQELINAAIFIAHSLGIPIAGITDRRLEKMGMAFLAVMGVNSQNGFDKAKDLEDNFSLTTREIIAYHNEHFEENISRGSYDDIRRKDLRYLVAADIVLNSAPNSAKNSATRGYGLNPIYAKLIRQFKSEKSWQGLVKSQLAETERLSDILKRERGYEKIEVTINSDRRLEFGPAEHNLLQKKIIEEFLPIFGYSAEVLYVGDAGNRFLHLDKEALSAIKFFEVATDLLPDIIAFSSSKNWLYLIEAVHSSGPIDELRRLELMKLAKDCTAELVFVTAFLDRPTFRKFVADIAWETEVWIADNPEHLIHFNGEKFLGPY